MAVEKEEPTELTFLDLKVQNTGSSLRVTIPAEVVRDAELEKGEQISGRYDRENGTLTYYLE